MKSTTSAQAVEESYRLTEGIYLLGSLERGVTVYKQQVRAHNLIWALSETYKAKPPSKIAVVGGGIAGLTVTACALLMFPDAKITMFEKRWELCPLQLGCDNRWLQPRIYDWPDMGSRTPSASLPVLNWSEGRASDVVRQILRGFWPFASAANGKLVLHIGPNYLKIFSAERSIDFIGHHCTLADGYLSVGSAVGNLEAYDIIILTAGFGLESGHLHEGQASYWRNEQLGQAALDGDRKTLIISGFGDGAIVDLCRLTISRFRQDSILYELFEPLIDENEKTFRQLRDAVKNDQLHSLQIFQHEIGVTHPAVEMLRHRIRRDTRVIMHLSGKLGTNTCMENVFGPYSCFLNQLLFFLLYRCGAFIASFDDLASIKKHYSVHSENTLLRHGTDVKEHIRSFFSDAININARLNILDQAQGQMARRLWSPGCF